MTVCTKETVEREADGFKKDHRRKTTELHSSVEKGRKGGGPVPFGLWADKGAFLLDRTLF